ncbi:MAG TPA: DUF6370 family protein [Fimbriiglobus sp.]|nr:DUF6370 family protein [Fimbriiglobus sp.]
MLRSLFALVVGVVALSLAAGVSAQDKKKGEKKTLEGKLVCGKCKLSETEKCSNVLLVEKDGKEIKYWLRDDGKKAKYHKCSGEKEVKVTGLVRQVKDKDGQTKMVISPLKKGEPIKVEDK